MKISNNFNPPTKPHLQFSAASFLRKKSNGEKTQENRIKKTNFYPCSHKIALQQAGEEKFFNSFLEKEGKVSLAEYQKIVKHHPSTISRSYFMCSENKTLGITPKSTAKMAIALKDYYDKKYKNYKIISIGTSPAVITETMQNLGADVLFLPISHLHQIGDTKLHPLRSKYPTISSRFPNIQVLMNYCTKKGISKDKNKEII